MKNQLHLSAHLSKILISLLISAMLITLPSLTSCTKEGITETTALDSEPATEAATDISTLPEAVGSDSLQNGGYNNPSYNNGNTNTNGNGNNAGQSNQIQGGITDVTTQNYSTGLSYISLGDGTCTVSGMGSCTDSSLIIPTVSPSGERVVAISEKAFFGSTSITAVFLPASISNVGAMAFAACPSLAYFSVDSANLSYKDSAGILYTADGSTLLSYPAAKSSSTVAIPTTVRRIADMAFYGCTKLTSVTYSGTLSQWQQITIGSNNNSLIGLNIQYNVSGK